MQFYETTIYDNDLSVSFSVLTIPGRSMPEFLDLKRDLGLTAVDTSAESYDQVVGDLFQLLNAAVRDVPIEHARGRRFSDPEGLHLLQFAEYIAHESSIPFEQSPLSGLSITQILKSPTTIGAAGGFILTGMYGPVYLVMVPAGMIICAAAKGIGDGLSEGLKHKIVKAMTGKAPAPKKAKKPRKKADEA